MIVAVKYGISHKDVKRTPFSLKNLLQKFVKAIGALLVPVIILGGIYGGIFTPTEAAGVACAYGLIVGIFIYRELNPKDAEKSVCWLRIYNRYGIIYHGCSSNVRIYYDTLPADQFHCKLHYRRLRK